MASSQSLSFLVATDSDSAPEAVHSALPPLPLSDAARRRVCRRLAIRISPESRRPFPQPPAILWRFDEEGCGFLGRGSWQDTETLRVELQVWTEPSLEPGALFGGDEAIPAAAERPELAAHLLACLYAVSVADSTLVLAFEAQSPEQLRNAELLAAFARAALPTPLRASCAVTLPLGSPETLVAELGTRVVAYPPRANELGAAYKSVSGRGGVLFSITDGHNAGAQPDAGCQAYAAAAVDLARRAPGRLSQFAHKAGLMGKELTRRPEQLPLSEISRLVESLEAPGKLDELLRGWQSAPDPNAHADLLEAEDFSAVSDAVLVEISGQAEPPLGGGPLQAKAMLELMRRPPPGSVRGADLLRGSPADPAAVQHAGRLLRAGLLGADLVSEWHAPVAEALSGVALLQALSAALEQGPAARGLSLALLERAGKSGDPAVAPLLREAKQAGRLNDLELALKSEQAYDAAARADLGLLEGLLQQRGWRLDAEQRRQVVQAALSREGRAVGPRLLFAEGRLRVPEDWLPEIVDCVSELPASGRADLRSEEWASLWAAVSDQTELAERLAPRLDERMALAPDAVTKALLLSGSWSRWKAASRAPAAVRNRAALEWLAARGPRKPHLEEWKAAIEDLRELDSEGLRRLAQAAGKSPELFDTIPYFETEQTADLIRLAPDDATRELWAQLLDRFPETDPYRSLQEPSSGYVLTAAGGLLDDAAEARRQALQFAASGDLDGAARVWPAFAQLSENDRLAAAGIGALRQGDERASRWSSLSPLRAGQTMTALLEFVRRRLTSKETTGLAGPLLRLLAHRPDWLEPAGGRLPALELLATLEPNVGIVVPAMQLARLAAAHGYERRLDWWRALALQARDCPRHDGRPNPLESWEHTRAYLYDRAASLPAPAARLLRRVLDESTQESESPVAWPQATLR